MKTTSTNRTRKYRERQSVKSKASQAAQQAAADLHLEAECYGITMFVEGNGIRLKGPPYVQARFFTRISALVPELLPIIRQAEETKIKREQFMQAAEQSRKPPQPPPGPPTPPNGKPKSPELPPTASEAEPKPADHAPEIKPQVPAIIENAIAEVMGKPITELRIVREPVVPDDLRDNCLREATAYGEITYDLEDELKVDEITRFRPGDRVYCANADDHNRLRCSANGKTITALSRRGTSDEGYWMACFMDAEPHSLFHLRHEGQRVRLPHEHDEPVNNRITDKQRYLLQRLGVPENKMPKQKKTATKRIDSLLRPMQYA